MFVRQTRRRRLLEHLLVAALHRAVATADGDDVAVPVGGDLHLDVSSAEDHRLDEERSVAERGHRLGGRRAEGLGDLGFLADDADAASAAAGRRLEHDREADPLGVLERFGCAPRARRRSRA